MHACHYHLCQLKVTHIFLISALGGQQWTQMQMLLSFVPIDNQSFYLFQPLGGNGPECKCHYPFWDIDCSRAECPNNCWYVSVLQCLAVCRSLSERDVAVRCSELRVL